MNDFQIRGCPLCRSSQREALFNVEVDQFCRINWSYNSDYRKILGIGDDTAYFLIDRCRRCGFIYARFAPSAGFLCKIYERVINTSIADTASQDAQDLARRLRYIAKLLCLVPDRCHLATLDFGCGFGATTRLATDCGIKMVAYDSSRVRVDAVKERCAGALAVYDLKNLEENGPYASIVMDNVLEHVLEPDLIVRFISGMLSPGAIVYLSVPSYEEANVLRLQKDIHRNRLSDMTLNPWEHLNYFDIEHLDRLMGKYGLVPLRGCELPDAVEIGLRPEMSLPRRIMNSVASGWRLVSYAISGMGVDSVQDRFYRHVQN
jgi:SAM-dependent methyltransferase